MSCGHFSTRNGLKLPKASKLFWHFWKESFGSFQKPNCLKWNWNRLSFLPFIFIFEQCDSSHKASYHDQTLESTSYNCRQGKWDDFLDRIQLHTSSYICLATNIVMHVCLSYPEPCPYLQVFFSWMPSNHFKGLIAIQTFLGQTAFLSIVVDLSVCILFLPSNIYFHAPSYSLFFFSWLHGSAQFPSTFLSFGSLCSKRKCIYFGVERMQPSFS